MREQGDIGDEHVKIEDRLITASLRAYDGAEREEVVALFTSFAMFPEDVVCVPSFFPPPTVRVLLSF